MMKKLAAALLAAAMTVSISAPAFAESSHDFVNFVAGLIGWETADIEGTNDVMLSGDLDLGTIAIADLKVLTDDSLGTGNYVDTDVVKPGKTYYIASHWLDVLVQDLQSNPFIGAKIGDLDMKELGKVFTDKKLVKFSAKKVEGSKLVDSVKLAEKTFDDAEGHTVGIAVKLNDFLTDDEQKIELELTFKMKDDIDLTRFGAIKTSGDPYSIYLEDGSEITFTVEFWTNNAVTTTDGEDAMAGDGGAIWKPTKNEEQEYTWEDENDTLATLKYDSDDGQTKMYYKLSTKWDNAYYAEHFADQDAFLYDFIAGPSASSTSRATLQLRVPFVDEDDELTCAEDEIYVYEMDEEGNLTDISNKFTFTEDDSNGYVLETKLRELGTYVVAGPLGAADADEAASAGVHTGIFLDAYL